LRVKHSADPIVGFVPISTAAFNRRVSVLRGREQRARGFLQNEGLLPRRANVQNNVAFGLQLAGIEENAATGNRAPDAEKKWGWGDRKRYIWQSPAVNVSGWDIAQRWRQIPSCCYSVGKPLQALDASNSRPDANPAAETLAGDGQAGAVGLPTIRQKKRCV